MSPVALARTALARAALAALCLAGLPIGPGAAAARAADAPAAFETKAKAALVVDGETGAVLFERNADVPFPPASLAKLMTMEVVFEAVEAKRLDLAQEFPVSEHAWRTGGAPSGTSTMFAKLKSRVPVDALIRGTIVQAANDAAIILAEGMAGSEEAFAGLMNDAGGTLGLEHSRFVNPTGLPADGQAVTVRDMVRLARHIEAEHPEFYGIYAQPDFKWNEIFQRNRNPLLPLNVGATGMGTGFTEASGYSLVGVTTRGGRKTFLAMSGLADAKERADEAVKLLNWSDSAFRREELFAAGKVVGVAAVYGGVSSQVPLLLREPVVALVPKDDPASVTARIRYDGPLRAPVAEGAKIGRIEVRIGDTLSVSRDLFAGGTVDQGTFASRAFDAAQELAFGWIRSL